MQKASKKPKLLVSFSGGRTSAYMLWWIWHVWPSRDEWDIIVVFANTGKEVEGTLFFVDECAQEWGIPIVWVEGYPSDKGKGWKVIPKVVTFETASRKGEPFEAMIAKLGIPSTNAPFCSDQLKRKTINAYLKTIKWRMFYKAIGIRADEPDRINPNAVAKRLWYPLAHDSPVIKLWILNWWKGRTFDLDIHPDDGNCDNCWKKNDMLLARNAVRKPSSFDWWQDMTNLHGYKNPRNSKLSAPFNFYRGNRSPKDIFILSKRPVAEIRKQAKQKKSSCTESCEPFK